MSGVALKPCPFCGGEAEIIRIGTIRRSMQIACTDCGCRVESGDVVGLTDISRYHWNTRSSTALASAIKERDEAYARVAKLEALLRDSRQYVEAIRQQASIAAHAEPYALRNRIDAALAPAPAKEPS